MTERERMVAGELYFAGEGSLRESMLRTRRLLRQYNRMPEDRIQERELLLRRMLGKMGSNVWIETPFRCDYGSQIFIGSRFFANYDCIFLDVCPITIGDDVLFGPRVCVYTACHPMDPEVRASGLEYGKPVTIGNRVWVGGNTVINPGVTIGNDVVIGSGSVVTRDLPDKVVAVGNPCRILREVNEEDHRYWKNKQMEYLGNGGFWNPQK